MMAVDQYHLGYNGATFATVVCHCTEDEIVTVGCDGREFTATAAMSTHFGRVLVMVDGLTRGQRYPYTINGVAAGTLRTWRASGQPIWVAVGSCWRPDIPDAVAALMNEEYDLDMLVLNGDFPYADWSDSINPTWGRECVSTRFGGLSANMDPDSYISMHKLWREIPGIKQLMHNVPCVWVGDDHNCYDNEAPPDSDGGLAHEGWRTHLGLTAPNGTFAEFQAAWAASREVAVAMSLGNPPAQAGEQHADGLYTRFALGDDTEVFLLDCIYARTYDNVADGPGKKMLGDTQNAWIDSKLQASTATWKFLISSKPFAAGSFNDRWSSYSTDRAARFTAWNGVMGLFSVGGDHHYLNDQWWAADTYGAGTAGFSCLNACPATVYGESAPTNGYELGIRWKSQGPGADTPNPGFNGYGLFKITSDRVERFILSHKHGLIKRGYIEAGSNQVQYYRTRLA